MHERIKELAEQASHQSPDGYPVTIPYSNDFVKVFAELIVKECAIAMSKIPGGYSAEKYYESNKIIYNHFKGE